MIKIQDVEHKGGWLGVTIEDVTSRLRRTKDLKTDEGAYVTGVSEDSPAEDAGIRKGDVIVKFDSRPISDSDDLVRAVRKAEPKTTVQIVVQRGSEQVTVSAKLRKRPRNLASTFFLENLPHIPPITRLMSFRTTMELQGMILGDITKQLVEYFEVPGRRGVLVHEVETGSDAGTAGFRAGDVIVKVNGYSIRNVNDMREEIDDLRGDKTTSFEVIRKGKPIPLTMNVEGEDDQSLFVIPEGEDQEIITIPDPADIDHQMDALREYVNETVQKRIRERINAGLKKAARSVMISS